MRLIPGLMRMFIPLSLLLVGLVISKVGEVNASSISSFDLVYWSTSSGIILLVLIVGLYLEMVQGRLR